MRSFACLHSSTRCNQSESTVDLLGTVHAKNCTNGGGTFTEGECPTEGRVGRCDSVSHFDASSLHVYTGDEKTLAKVCERLEGTMSLD